MVSKTKKTTALQRKAQGLPPSNAGRINELAQMDPTTYQAMLTYVRAGAYDSVAAKSLGVTPRTFARWKTIGAEHDEQDVESEYRQFYLDLTMASGKARLRAEIKVADTQPLVWLLSGPGRPTQHEEGWSEDKTIVQHEGGENPLLIDHVHRILGEDPKARVKSIAGAFDVFKELAISPDKVTDLLSEKAAAASDDESQDFESGELVSDVKTGYQPDSNGNGKH